MTSCLCPTNRKTMDPSPHPRLCGSDACGVRPKPKKGGQPLLQDFHILKIIGKGTYGEVYSAFDMKRNQTVVIKQISKTLPEDLIRYEVTILKHLQQSCEDHILCYIDFKEDSQFYYIITEYLDKYLTLIQFTEKYHTITDANLVKLITNLLVGLKEIHELGVVHRDIKPENIMINPKTFDIKYIDFGLACINLQYACDGIYGSPDYEAPEIRDYRLTGTTNNVPISIREWMKADYWSLGMTIYEILLGEPMSSYNLRHLDPQLSIDNPSDEMYLIDEMKRFGLGLDPRLTRQIYKDQGRDPVMTQFLITHVDPLVRGLHKRQLVI